ncbi:equilibrative nucleoside transporter 1 isoform X2 [Ischnura elegans]|uniref:equilibrative nucleoside transporter 1 isoform X2 n=2 Tax=Ischnura elegans TaxID=197161 RepID=UPI001ED8A899|nr:equilibrative nucleoside transporter 1 isoform X2 [Ischnura elegans]
MSNSRISELAEHQSLLRQGKSRNGASPSVVAMSTMPASSVSKRSSAGASEPVRLTPSWEESNLPNDELNFKEVTMEQADLEMNPPWDRCYIVYLIFLLHGMGTLMPWNMFITAKGYFVDYKMSKEYTGAESNYATNFLAYIGFAAQVPNLVFNWLNVFIQLGGSLTRRIVWSIFVEVIVFILTVVLAMTDSSGWPGVFFWVTMATVVLLNMACGIYQNSVYGMAARLPFKYTGAVVLGSNISGTFTAIISIISLAVAPNVRTAAIYYFITALFILLACFDTYFALPLNRFYRYHELLNQKGHQSKLKENLGVIPQTPYLKIFKQCLPQLFNVFFVFFVSLSIFPAVHSDIQRSDENFFLSDKYFTAVTCFLTFNFFAMVGCTTAAWFQWPGPKYLVVPVVLRLLFIPFFVLCNYLPQNLTRVFPILIKNDWAYWAGGILLGLTSGHFSSLAMMYCPRMVEPHYKVTAGMYGAASLITGIFSGILFTMIFPWFVSEVSWNFS